MDLNEMNERIRIGLNTDSVSPREYHRYRPTSAMMTEREAMNTAVTGEERYGRKKREDDGRRRDGSYTHQFFIRRILIATDVGREGWISHEQTTMLFR
jgi:hypothetical protein